MKTLTKFTIVLFLISANFAVAQGSANDPDINSSDQKTGRMMGSMWHWDEEKSPGVAALLSLQPMPVAIGNFYAGDWEKGILYTTLELVLIIPAMTHMGDRHMGNSHHSGYSHYHDHEWSDNDRALFYSLITGYIAVKIISAYDAGYSVERQLQAKKDVSMNVVPGPDGWILSARVSF